jgi:hypothetical protein
MEMRVRERDVGKLWLECGGKCQVMSFSAVEYVETTEIGVCGENLQKLRT